jgi:SAM-dependent methyltransferase
MHTTAMRNAARFFEAYARYVGPGRLLDIGAQDVNGSLRQVCPPELHYTGVDFVAGRGVDVVLQDPYTLPFASESVDVVISSSCFEHSQMFWVLFLELLRVLKPTGLLYLDVPSNGLFHRYPVDCWRFYPDSGGALVEWARRHGSHCRLLESFIGKQEHEPWNDFVAVFLKDGAHHERYPRRMLHDRTDYYNGVTDATAEILRPEGRSEDLLFRAPTRPARRLLAALRTRFSPAKSLR